MEIFVLAAILGAAFCFLIWLLARQNREMQSVEIAPPPQWTITTKGHPLGHTGVFIANEAAPRTVAVCDMRQNATLAINHAALQQIPLIDGSGQRIPSLVDPEPRRLALRAAKRNGWRVTVVYCDITQGAITERTISPISCGTDGIWAECELRQDKRSFRYDRILALEVHAASKIARDRYRVQHI